MQYSFPIFAAPNVRSSSLIAVAVAHPINNPGGPVSINPQPLPPRVYLGGLVGSPVIAAMIGR